MSRQTVAILVAIMTTSFALPVLAEPDVELRIPKEGMEFLTGRLPLVDGDGTITIADFDDKVMSCPWGDDSVFEARNIRAQLTAGKIKVKASPGNKLQILITGEIDGSAEVDLDKPACVGGSIGCDVTLRISYVEAVGTFTPVVEGKKLRLKNPQIDVTLNKSDVKIKVSSCGLAGSVANLVISMMEGKLIDKTEQWLQDLLRDQVPSVENALSSLTMMGGQTDKYSVNGTANVDWQDGEMSVKAKLDVTATQTPSCDLTTAPPIPEASETPAFQFNGDHVGIAVSSTILNKAIVAAWNSGAFCFDDLLSGLDPNVFGGLLGLPNIDTATASVTEPPTVTMVPGDGARLKINLSGFEVSLKSQGNDISVSGGLTLNAAVDIDPDTRSVVLDDLSLDFNNLKATGGLSTTLIEQLVNTMIQGPLQAQMQQLAVVPSVFKATGGDLDNAHIYLTRAKSTDSHALIYAKLYLKSGHNNNPPDTSFAEAMDSCKPGLLNVRASGTDDDSPSQLLQYKFRVDDGAWSEPSYSPNFAALLQTAGKHVIEAAAIDLDGNVDPTPARHEVQVDQAAPPPGTGTGTGTGTGPGTGTDTGTATKTSTGNEMSLGVPGSEDGISNITGGCSLPGTGAQSAGQLLLVLLVLAALGRTRRRR